MSLRTLRNKTQFGKITRVSKRKSTTDGDQSPLRGSAYSMAHNLSASSPPATTTAEGYDSQHTSPIRLCDPRLGELNIQKWTDVSIDNDTAARCVSLYLETDHPLLGHFDPELFVSDLVSYKTQYCSSLLVNALLYWACVSIPDPTFANSLLKPARICL